MFGGLPVALQSPVVTVVVIVIGVVLWWNGVRFRRGREARAVLVVFGAVACVGLWPLLLVVPASCCSQRWFSLPHADSPSAA